jgi:ribosomal protein S18 acetylase RimI-like enzyme
MPAENHRLRRARRRPKSLTDEGRCITVEMVKVRDATQIEAVADLAREIWNEHFVSIIGQAQVDYMLSRFQSAAAIREQIAAGYEYYLVSDGGQHAGYFALVPARTKPSAQLSKIYVRQAQRGRGLGKAIMEFVNAYCVERGIGRVWLTVNRHNAGSIAFYERMGFTKAERLVRKIGHGFVMDDYKMVKRPLASQSSRDGSARNPRRDRTPRNSSGAGASTRFGSL